MSRGPGWLERAIVSEITHDDWTVVIDLAIVIFGDMTEADTGTYRAAVESTRRACKRLARRGLVELDHQSTFGGSFLWSEVSVTDQGLSPRWELVVSLI